MKIIYLKLTNRCNLQCKHCYNTISYNYGIDMDQKTIDASIDYIKNILKNEDVTVVFHGGEPILASIEKIQYVIDKLNNFKNITFNITTNLIYELTDEHIKLFKQFTDSCNINCISTSWDYFIRFKDLSQEQLWLKNIQILQNNQIEVQPIICITKYLINEYKNTDKLFEYLVLNNIHQINFERLTLTGRATDSMRPLNADIDKWLYNAYLSSEKYNVYVNLFDTLKEACKNKNFIGCRKRQCVKNVITINPDGLIAGCPNTANIIFGNVNDKIINFTCENYCNELKKEEIKNNQCYLCSYFQYCNGECYQLKFDESGCPGLKLLIEKFLCSVQQ